MKIGFKRGNKWHASVIRAVLNSQWSHGVVVIDGVLHESVALKNEHGGSGVRCYPITDAIAADYVWIDIGGDDAAALARFKEVQGYGYDYLSLISFLPIFNVRDSKRMYCWELVLWMIGGYAKWRVTAEIILTFVLRK
jgi:hypothetical protein